MLTNSVVPTGTRKISPKVVVPQGAIEKAQLGLGLLKDAIYELAQTNPNGIKNSDAASMLGLRSDYMGKQKDYLSYSVLGLLIREGKIYREPETHNHKAKS